MIKQDSRKYVAALVVWFLIANLLYFGNIKEVSHQCAELPGWLPLWIPFTFGIDELFPYAFQMAATSDLPAVWRGEAELYCHENFLFHEVGYAYFMLMPVAIVIGGHALYRWAFNTSDKVTTTE